MVIVPRIAAVSCLSATPFIYGVKHSLHAGLSLSDSAETVRRFSDLEADIALVPACAVPALSGAQVVTDYCIGGIPAAADGLRSSDDPLVGWWKPFGELPFAFALWVARKGTDPETLGALQHALTFGLEHLYEALLEARLADPAAAYETLSQFDFIYDVEKRRALRKFWNSGLKTVPRANPG